MCYITSNCFDLLFFLKNLKSEFFMTSQKSDFDHSHCPIYCSTDQAFGEDLLCPKAFEIVRLSMDKQAAPNQPV